MPGDAPAPFRVELRPRRATIVVAPQGDVDIATSGELHDKLLEVMGAGFRRVVLDLRRVSFLDSTGLRVVLQARSAGTDSGVDFALVPGPEPVQRLFDITGTASILHFVDDGAID